MSVDAGLATIIVAVVSTIGILLNTTLTLRQNKKVDETHKQVTVNHHSSETPTVLDRIDDVKQLVLQQAQVLNDHISHSNEMDSRLMAVESEVRQSR